MTKSWWLEASLMIWSAELKFVEAWGGNDSETRFCVSWLPNISHCYFEDLPFKNELRFKMLSGDFHWTSYSIIVCCIKWLFNALLLNLRSPHKQNREKDTRQVVSVVLPPHLLNQRRKERWAKFCSLYAGKFPSASVRSTEPGHILT